jgi:hypothetical protein
MFTYKCMNSLIDFDFDLTKNEDIHEHYTRHRRDLHLLRAKTNKGKQRPTYQASIDFNNVERDLQDRMLRVSLSISVALLLRILYT